MYARVTELKTWIKNHAPGAQDSDCALCSDEENRSRVKRMARRKKKHRRMMESDYWLDPCSFVKKRQ